MPRTPSSNFLIVAAIASLALTVTSAQAPSQAPGNADAVRQRTLFFQRDYETALLEGARLVAPDAARAWYLLNMARIGQEDEAVTAARKMVSDAPASGWSWLALAGALNYQGDHSAEAIEAGAKAFQMMPDNPDAVWIHAQTMASEPKKRQEALAFIDSRRSRLANPAEILVTKGYVLYVLSSEPTRDEAKLTAALETFDEARRADPTNLNALYLPGTYLSGLRRSDEAHLLLKQAIAIAPGSSAVHQAYWRALNGSQTLSKEQKDAEIQSDMTAFLKAYGTRPGVLHAASSMSGELKLTDQQKALEETILQKFSSSIAAEWVLADRWRGFSRTKEGAQNPEYRRILTDYVARPVHHHKGLLGEAYRNLFFVLVEDKDVAVEELRRVLDGMITFETMNVHITHASAPVALADKKILLPEAERVARDSMVVLKKKVDSQRAFYANQGEYERQSNWMISMGHDALGWVLFAEGHLADAERELLISYEFHHESRVNLHHLGKFYEAKGDIPRAEDFYVKGLGVQAPGVNPCETALKALYEKRRGAADGFDKYLADLRDADRVRRRTKVLGERLSVRESTPAFNLKALDGTRVSLESLKGKIVVVNFWGIWCGWCIQELPDYQKLFEKYKGDADVVILTIDNDRNPDDVPPWMKEKKYTFPVLLDDGYVEKAGIHAFPTTWFIDREGRRAFVKVGWSEKLLEEFAWRIEAIR